ncbi:carboxypeptidase-like regulatory domain-containing protein [archaeon]|nr:carboxypeptidase-like regulatory domain-containing protein [archaeon]
MEFLPLLLIVILIFSAGCTDGLDTEDEEMEITITDQHGAPIPNAKITMFTDEDIKEEVTGETGEFKGSLSFGSSKNYSFYVEKEGCSRYSEQGIQYKDGKHEVTLTCMTGDVQITFEVKNQNGNPLSGVTIYLVDRTERAPEALEWDVFGIVHESWHIEAGMTDQNGKLVAKVEKGSVNYYTKKIGCQDDTTAVPAYKDITHHVTLHCE